MPTLDDAPLDEEAPAEQQTPVWGEKVDGLIAAAEASPRARMRALGKKAEEILSTLNGAIERETRIAAAEAELARLKRGED